MSLAAVRRLALTPQFVRPAVAGSRGFAKVGTDQKLEADPRTTKPQQVRERLCHAWGRWTGARGAPACAARRCTCPPAAGAAHPPSSLPAVACRWRTRRTRPPRTL